MNKPNLPITSKMANNEAAKLKIDHQKKIMEVLSSHPEGLTYEEISSCAGLDKHAVGRRVSELERDLKIHKPGTTKPTSTGRKAFVYKVFTLTDYSKALTQKELF